MQQARFMESYESRHSDHSFTAAVVSLLLRHGLKYSLDGVLCMSQAIGGGGLVLRSAPACWLLGAAGSVGCQTAAPATRFCTLPADKRASCGLFHAGTASRRDPAAPSHGQPSQVWWVTLSMVAQTLNEPTTRRAAWWKCGVAHTFACACVVVPAGLLSRGDAGIFMRFPPPTYRGETHCVRGRGTDRVPDTLPAAACCLMTRHVLVCSCILTLALWLLCACREDLGPLCRLLHCRGSWRQGEGCSAQQAASTEVPDT